MNLRDWWLRLRTVVAPRRAERDLEDELSFHVELETRKMIDGGMDPKDARKASQARFGSTLRAADECRDERRTAFVDDLTRDTLFAVRTFKRAPLAALTIVATVGLGLGLVAVAFTMLNAMLFRVDAVPNVHEMHAMTRPRHAAEERLSFTRRQFDAIRTETRAFADAYAEVSQVDGRLDGQLAWGTFVTGNFADVLGVRAALGRSLAPIDDTSSAGEAVIVLSHRGWDRLFARDPTVVGRAVRINGFKFEVVGVMPEDFRGLALAPDDYWAPLSTLGRVRHVRSGQEEAIDVDIVGRLRRDVTADTARAELAVWDVRDSVTHGVERRVSDISLVPKTGVISVPQEALLVTGPLFFAFGLVLLIGCANVASLLMGRAVARQREISVRLSLGAPRRRIVRQLLTESLLLSLLACGVGFAISRIVLRGIVDAIVTSMPPDLGDIRLWAPDADWRVLCFLIVAAFVSTAFFALAPALHATRIDPIATLRGGAGSGRAAGTRNLLIGLQVCASTLLLICSFVFLRSTYAASTFEPGFRTSDTVTIQIPNETTREGVVRAIRNDPTVVGMAAESGERSRAVAETQAGKASVRSTGVSAGYFDVLDIAVLRGRAFTPTESGPEAAVALVSETAAQALWPNAEAVGQVLRLTIDDTAIDDTAIEARSYRVAGVVRDVPGLRVAPLERAVIYVPTSPEARGTSLVARVHGDPERARQILLDRVTAIEPAMSRSILTMRTLAGMEKYFLKAGFSLTIALGVLALVLTLSGLFSVLSYLVEQRRREIGVRMAVGASARDIARLFVTQSMRPVGLGLALGAGLAGTLAGVLLATPAAAPVAQAIQVLDPVAYGGSLALILLACLAAASIPATRAARLDPTRTLRDE